MVGQTVTLYEKTKTGLDAFGAPVYEEIPVTVENVLIGEPTTDEISQAADLYEKKIMYMIGIPKGDTHNWVDSVVEWVDAYGIRHKCRSFGLPITGIEKNIPTPWHMKVRLEAYE